MVRCHCPMVQWRLTIRLWCPSPSNQVTSVTLIYMYIHSFFLCHLLGMYTSLSLPLTISAHVSPPICHSPDDDAHIGIETLGNKVSLWLEPKFNIISITVPSHSGLYKGICDIKNMKESITYDYYVF